MGVALNIAATLAGLMRRHDGIDVALAAWNAGEGTVGQHGGKMPPFPETRSHVRLRIQPNLSETAR